MSANEEDLEPSFQIGTNENRRHVTISAVSKGSVFFRKQVSHDTVLIVLYLVCMLSWERWDSGRRSQAIRHHDKLVNCLFSTA